MKCSQCSSFLWSCNAGLSNGTWCVSSLVLYSNSIWTAAALVKIYQHMFMGFSSEKLNFIKYFKNSQNAAGYWLPQWIRSTASLGINPKAKDAQLQKNDLKTQHMLYFWRAGGLRMSKMTFPCVNPIQLGPSHFNLSPQYKKKALYVINSGEIPED